MPCDKMFSIVTKGRDNHSMISLISPPNVYKEFFLGFIKLGDGNNERQAHREHAWYMRNTDIVHGD